MLFKFCRSFANSVSVLQKFCQCCFSFAEVLSMQFQFCVTTHKVSEKLHCCVIIKVHDLESELAGEQRRHGETQKSLRRHERRVMELTEHFDNDVKNKDREQDMFDRVQQKMKQYKRQLDEAVSFQVLFESYCITRSQILPKVFNACLIASRGRERKYRKTWRNLDPRNN